MRVQDLTRPEVRLEDHGWLFIKDADGWVHLQSPAGEIAHISPQFLTLNTDGVKVNVEITEDEDIRRRIVAA